MFGVHSDNGYVEILNGIKIKTLCYDDAMLMSKFILEKGSVLPEHSHPNVQTGYLIKGKIRLIIQEELRELLPGDSWCIQKDLKHRAEILEDSVAVEVFSPLRKDYLKYVYDVDIEQ